jgi:hypothetical protein
MPETLSKIFGRRHFEDSIGVCTFTNTVSLSTILGLIDAIAGWDMDVAEAMAAGRRVGLILRANQPALRHWSRTGISVTEVRQRATRWPSQGRRCRGRLGADARRSRGTVRVLIPAGNMGTMVPAPFGGNILATGVRAQ